MLYLLGSGGAHLSFEKAASGLTAELRGKRADEGLPYTIWSLIEHLRIAQWDILEFSQDAKHASPEWPRGYWPKSDSPEDDAAWEHSLSRFRSDLKAMERLAKNPKIDLYARIPRGDGQTILREALLTADHNAYHLGQIVALRRLIGAWEENR